MATAWPRCYDHAATSNSLRCAPILPRVLFVLLAMLALVAAACTTQRAEPVLVDAVMPHTAETPGGLVIVHGQNFAPGAQVKAGNTLLLTTWINSRYLAARLPLELAGGTVDIIVRNPDGAQAQLPDALTLAPASPSQPQVASAAPTPSPATPSPTPAPATPSPTPAPQASATPALVLLPATTALPTPTRVPVTRATAPPAQVLVPPPAPYASPVSPAPVGPAPYAGPVPPVAISPAQNAPPQQPEPAPVPAEQPAAPQPASPPQQNPQPVATRVTEPPPPPPVPADTQPHLVCPPGLHIPPDAARQITCF